ncbi:uncharacterized protein N7487_001549 [Penicillium crustosum]|uniref:uncharacterized protein n=1 Tax=Penicillium crustosum TaxID=36656 RepID=UPI00239FC281|nr:uncharacterized protein N7487_001549 [Penicillium crustosum]KAJ5417999.1 hypothetical protein N7487_001549 [Penicillium crustosum]
MTSLLTNTVPWNQGEEKLHHRLRVPHCDNQTALYLSPRAASLGYIRFSKAGHGQRYGAAQRALQRQLPNP